MGACVVLWIRWLRDQSFDQTDMPQSSQSFTTADGRTETKRMASYLIVSKHHAFVCSAISSA